ncbi:type 1 glutamine amidotransferase [Shewanella inventionis]|uniref:Amidotransferase n=1 Tax=Shewanella inventionis TaxID=1738770 RepID=A0ABQ1J1W2_9GAMM|nr:type 1 glutamine amidotransferase [Shewanella inventionis]MCL1157475.1 type 1 glutamine amidotransferase [Shewanella inventionis]UAL43539.1 type 1 glutamine amidotransferase [Shewanella inventionis]GGB58076.1 amidotransferase [Shewanella inventionis]
MIQPTIAVFQHHPAEGVGRIELWAERRNITLECFYAPDELPASLMKYQGLIVLGGPMNVADNPLWMRAECALINQALELPRPILAICLGAQLLATQLGGKVVEMPEPELGWQQVSINGSQVLAVPQWHYQAIALPQHIDVLASSALCQVQMFRHQHAIGLQFHPEWDSKQMTQLQEHFADECPFSNTLPQNALHTEQQNQLEQFLFALLDQQFKSA